MSDLPTVITNSNIWKETLSARDTDQFSGERERLRTAFVSFRERAGYLASEIRKDLPDLTVHDLTHLDALWDIASTIVGDNYFFTPTESFMLGGSILLHDLVMSVASIEGGYLEIKKDVRWTDLVLSEYQTTYGRDPTEQEAQEPEGTILNRVMFNYLRQIHGEKAEKLAFQSYTLTNGTPTFLIEDTEIRQTFGRVMGLIAHSHWWSIEDVDKNFNRVIGAPHWCPREWIVDPLKISCTLRTADASHLDTSRAPSFLRAITNISPSSQKHWQFQEKLNKPYLDEDALVFTSGAAFPQKEAGSWWLCFEALKTLDNELRSVDALFAEKSFQRFAAKRVAGVDLPERLMSYIQTDGWLPLNATVHVNDLPAVIKSIGGEELYGKNPTISLRELIQNACDAVRARRVYEKREPEFGCITISISEDAEGDFWLEVSDNGIGMSKRVLTDVLLDFGQAFWGSIEMQEEFPGLLSSGFRATGKYGIGFFSVFMVADNVQVTTRRSDAAARDTLILEFSSGLSGRPILRPANRDEQLVDCGTRIRIKLINDPNGENGILYTRGERLLSLMDLCRRICPAVDVDIYTIESGTSVRVVRANDWQSVDGHELLARLGLRDEESSPPKTAEDLLDRAGKNLRLLKDDDGEVFGRACISIGHAGFYGIRTDVKGVVTVGGLRSVGLSGIGGILVGQPIVASRDDAIPIVPQDVLKQWAEEQSEIVPNLWKTPEEQQACAEYIHLCGGLTRSLPIAKFKGHWVSAEEIANMSTPPETAVIIDNFLIRELSLLESYSLDDTVFVTLSSGIPGVLHTGPDWPETRVTNKKYFAMNTLAGAVINALSIAWKVSIEDILKENDLERDHKVTIGKEGEREIQSRALRITKPQQNSSSS